MSPEVLSRPQPNLPVWVPEAARLYLTHTETGRTLRDLARSAGCHASTVLRQVRRVEARRDDLLVDMALDHLGATHFSRAQAARTQDTRTSMKASRREAFPTPTDADVEREARRILRRLSEPGACLAVAPDMEKAVVVRDPAGQTVRTAVVDRPWPRRWRSTTGSPARRPAAVSRYRITQAGRAALKRILGEDHAGSRLRRPAPRDAERDETDEPGRSDRTPAALQRGRKPARDAVAAEGQGRAAVPDRRMLVAGASGCARISSSPRWARASRRTGTGS
jgi:hypothetical protein